MTLLYKDEPVKIVNCCLDTDSTLKVKVVVTRLEQELDQQEYFYYITNIVEWVKASELEHPHGLNGVIECIYKLTNKGE